MLVRAVASRRSRTSRDCCRKGEVLMDGKDAGIKDGFVKTRNHGRIHFRELGRGDPLILMHTNGGSAYQHDVVAPLLAPHLRMISWTMPGHGDSDPLSRHY